MEKVRLGKTELMVTRVGFGGIPIQRLSDAEAVDVVAGCLDLGVNFIDTAAAYTSSEARIGRAIRGRRDGLVLATKTHGRTGPDVRTHLNNSLAALGTDFIDIYQMHGVNDAETYRQVLAQNGPLAVAREAQQAGIVGHIGITSHSREIARQALEDGHFETLMFAFNFIVDEAADELLPVARRQDIGFIGMKPLGGGELYHGRLAFRFLMQYPDVVPIPGIDALPQMVEITDVVNAPAPLSADERREIERIRLDLGSRFCRHCDYCQPCEQGINISVVFYMRSIHRRSAPAAVFSDRMEETVRKSEDCIECGDCEPRCPYHLPIREMLVAEREWYLEQKRQYQNETAGD